MLVTRNPVICFLKFDKTEQTYVDVFGILPRFLESLVQGENLVCSATAGTKTTMDFIQLWFNYFAGTFLKALGISFPRRLRREISRYLVYSLQSLSLCMGMISQFSNLSVLFQNTGPPDTHESAKELIDSRLWAFHVGLHHSLQPGPAPVPSPRWGSGGLSLPKQGTKPPQIEIWHTLNQWRLYQIFNIKPPRTNVKHP